MKKSILSIAMVAFSILSINATENNKIFNTLNEVLTLSKENMVQVFDRHVTTNKSTYSGTSLNLEHANKMIAIVSTDEVVLEKKIESFYMLNYEAENNSNRLYFWEVESTYGHAKGFSSSEADAYRMIQLIAKGEIVTSKVIISGIIEGTPRKKAQVKK